MGRYLRRMYRLLGMPEDGIPIGLLRPADSPALVKTLARQRLQELTTAAAVPNLPPVVSSEIAARRFHTWEDFLATSKQGRPGRSDIIAYGHSLDHEGEDAAGYLRHIGRRDAAFGRFLETPAEALIDSEAFETSVYITGETKSGKSYLSQLLAWRLAGREKSSVWILDPHGPLARACSEWSKLRQLPNTYYFDVGLAGAGTDSRRPRFNPFDQLPDKNPATLDIVTQEQVNAFSIMANYSAFTDNMRSLFASCIYLMLEMETGSMQELYRLMDDTRNHDLVMRGMRLRNEHHRKLFAHDFRKKKYTATKEALATRLSGLLSFEALYDIVSGKSTFSIPQAFNTPGVYIFNLGKGVIGETAGAMLGRLILSQLQAAAFKREKDGLTEHLVPTKNYVFIDEFQNFVSETTGTIVAEARKYGISLILIQQYIGQGVEPGLMQNILTNTPLKITGVGTLSSYEKVMASQQVDREGFEGLRPRRFHVSRRGSQPFVTEAHGFLAGSQERMTGEEQAAFTQCQLARYYRSPSPDANNDAGDAEGVTVVRNIPSDEFTPPKASEMPPRASRFSGPGEAPPLPTGARGSAAQAAVREALGGTAAERPESPAAADQGTPRRRERQQPTPDSQPDLPDPLTPRSPALRDEAGPVPQDPDPAAPQPPDRGPVPAAGISPEVFQSGRKRPKYPAS